MCHGVRLLLLLSAILGLLPAATHAEPMVGVVEHCFACHRQNGQTQGLMVISGRDHRQLSALLLDFKYDRRQATLMPRLLKAFSDEELQALAILLEQR